MVFGEEGTTASDAPYYKSLDEGAGTNYYIYHDLDCSSSGDGTARWVIDDTPPNINAMQDLDADGACEYMARINSDDKTTPPASATWKMHCGDTLAWQDVSFTFEDISSHAGTPGVFT